MAPSILGLASAILGIPTITTFIQNLISALTRNSEYIENVQCTRNQLQEFEDEDLLDKMSILLTPTAYSDGSLNTVIPPYQVLPTELVTNGTFDTDSNWLKSSTATISNGSAHIVSDGSYQYIGQVSVLTVGKKYRVEYEIIENNSGNLKMSSSFGSNFSPISSTVGFHSFEAVAIASTLYIERQTACDIKIDNVSVKEVQEADFDFSRGSSATRVNEQGLVEDVQILSGELVQNGNFEQIGAEEVTNGNFENWTADNPDSWTVLNEDANNYVTQDGSYARIVSNDTASIQIKQTIFTIGKSYKVELDAVVNSGNVEGLKLNDATAAATIGYVNSTGHHTFYFKAAGTALVINRKGGGDTDISIDNVSVKEVGQNWSFGTGWSMGDGKVIADGTMVSNVLEQDYDFIDGSLYRFTFTIKDYVSGSLFIRQPFNGSLDVVSANGTYSFDYVAGSTNALKFRGNSFIGSIDDVSFKLVTDDTDLPRIDYTDGTGSLLLEPQRTNYVTHSNDISQFTTLAVGGTLTETANYAEAPNGENEATRLQMSASGSNYALKGIVTSAFNDDYYISIYLKSNTSENQQVTIYGRNSLTQSYTVTTQWQRFKVSCNNASGSAFFYFGSRPSYSSDENLDILAWGGQLEQGDYATSYIPTESASVTRSADVANNSGNADLFNDSEGVLYAEVKRFDNDTDFTTIGFTDGTIGNQVSFKFRNSTNVVWVVVKSGGVSQVQMQYTASDLTTFNKMAVKYKANDFAFWFNGVQVLTDTSGIVATGLDKLAFDDGAGGAKFVGNTKALAVFKEALSNDLLERLTGEGYESFRLLAEANNYTII